MSFDVTGLHQAVTAQGRVARVVVASVQGSAPREPGAAMLVWADGQSGTIGGGELEHRATAEARQALDRGADRVARMPLGPALGQCCGGSVVLVTEVYDASRAGAVIGPAALRRVDGDADAPLPLRRAAARARSAGAAVPVLFKGGWLLEPVSPLARPMWIYGAGHVGRALVSVLAPLPDFAITWVDTSEPRFPPVVPDGVARRVTENPAGIVADAPAHAEHLILTYSHALDLELCHRLLSHGFRGAGLIGSATKWARFRNRLAALGHAPAQIARIRCPIGDTALGKHPQAIAVGVAAQLLAPAAAGAVTESQGEDRWQRRS